MRNSEEPLNDRAHTAALIRRRLKWVIGAIIITLVAVILIFWSSKIGPAGKAAATKEIAEQARVLIRDCNLYAADYSNRLPPHLAAIVLRGTSTRNLIDPASQVPPPAQPPFGDPQDWKKIAPAIDAASIFIYTGDGVRSTDSPNIILLYTRRDIVPRQRLVGFVDGRVELLPESQLDAIFEANNNARRDAKRNPIALDKP